MRIDADGFSFDFTDAIDAFIFDEKDSSKLTFHGLPMKAVDIIAEFDDAYIFVEMKDFDDPALYKELKSDSEDEKQAKRDSFKWLKNYLKYKYRDTFLFRYAEDKVEKPVHYICLLTFDNAVNNIMQKALKKELPVGRTSRRWVRPIAASCHVMNVEKWNREFPKWPVVKQ